MPPSEGKDNSQEILDVDLKLTTEELEEKVRIQTQRLFWKSRLIKCKEFVGHNGFVGCIDSVNDTLVSGSTDRSIKVWDINSLEEIRNLGGHTDTVTCIQIYDAKESALIAKEKNIDLNGDYIIISCSLDASIRFWKSNSGEHSRIYTYNPLISFCSFLEERRIFSASLNGKLELWDISEISRKCCSMDLNIKIAIPSIELTSMKKGKSDYVFIGAIGQLFIISIKNDDIQIYRKIQPSFNVLDQTLSNSINGMVCDDDGRGVWVVDNSHCLKHLNLSNDDEMIFTNALTRDAYSEALCLFNSFIFATSYSNKTEISSVHVRDKYTGRYITTISDEFLRKHINDILVKEGDGKNFQIFTAGDRLVVYQSSKRRIGEGIQYIKCHLKMINSIFDIEEEESINDMNSICIEEVESTNSCIIL